MAIKQTAVPSRSRPGLDNVARSYVYSFVSSFGLTDSIWMLYLASRGMSLVEIGLLESIFHLTSLFMEIPTGIVADRFGRRSSRILSRAVACVATLLMLASRDFAGFALAFVLTALGYNLESGAGDALVYDTLVDQGREGDYMKVKGRQEIGYQSASALSLVAGGAVATWNYELAYLLTSAIHLVSLLMALGFTEPLAGRQAGGAGGRPSLRRHIVDSFAVIRGNRGVFVYILFIETFSLFYTTVYFWFQTFLKAGGWKEWAIGLLLGASSAAAVIMATLTHRIEARLGRAAIVRIAPLAAILCFGLIAFTGLEAGSMVALAAIEGLLFVSFSDYINRLIPSESRATLLSFQAMTFSVMMIFFFPAIGALSASRGYKAAFVAIFAASVPVLVGARAYLLADIGKEGSDMATSGKMPEEREHLIGEERVTDGPALAERMVAEAERIWASGGWRREGRRGGVLVESKPVSGPFEGAGVRLTRSSGEIEAPAGLTFELLVSPAGYAVIDPISDPKDHLAAPLEVWAWREGSRLEAATSSARIPFLPPTVFVVLNAIDPGSRVFASKSIIHDSRPGGSRYSGEAAPPDGSVRALNTFAFKVEPVSETRCRVLCVNYADMAGITPAFVNNLIDTKFFLPPFYKRLAKALSSRKA